MTASQTHRCLGTSESGTWDHPWECGSRCSDDGSLLEAIPQSSYQPQEDLSCSGIPAEMSTPVECFHEPGTHGGPHQEKGELGPAGQGVISDRNMPGCIPSLGRLPRDVQGLKHTFTTHSWKRVLLVPERQDHTALVPLAGHAVHLFFPVPYLQTSCVVSIWGSPSAAGSPWRGRTWQEGQHRPLQLHLSQPASLSLSLLLPQLTSCGQGRTRLGKTPQGHEVQSSREDFSNIARDPNLGFMSLKKKKIQKLGIGWGWVFCSFLEPISTKLFWCLKFTFIFFVYT